jgi:hypothetical protein
MVFPNLGRDAKLGTQEGGPELRYQLLECISFRAKPHPVQLPHAAGLLASPVRQLLQHRTVVALPRGTLVPAVTG